MKRYTLCLLIVIGCSENPREREDKGQEGRGEDHPRNQDPEEGAPPQCHSVIRGKSTSPNASQINYIWWIQCSILSYRSLKPRRISS